MPEENREAKGGVAKDSESRRAAHIKWVITVGVIFVVVTLIVYAVLYVRSSSQSVLINSIGLALGLVGLGMAFWLVNRGRLDGAAYWVLFTLVVGYGFGELAWRGQTLSNTIGGLLLFVIVGRLTLPRRWKVWLAVTGAYGLGILLINLFEPLPRQNALDDPLLTYFDIGTIVSLVGLALWRLTRVMVARTIRLRLLVAFVLVVLPVAGSITAVSAALGVRNGRQQAFDNLNFAIDYKVDEVETSLGELQEDLAVMVADEASLAYVDILTKLVGVDPSDTHYATAFADLLMTYTLPPYQFEAIYLLDIDGQVMVSTDRQLQSTFMHQRAFFKESLSGPYVGITLDPKAADRRVLVVAQPAVNRQGETAGVMVATSSLAELEGIVGQQMGLGETESAYLVADDYIEVIASRLGETGEEVHSYAIDRVLDGRVNGAREYTNHRGIPVMGAYRWIGDIRAALLTEQDQDEVFAVVYGGVWLSAGVALIVALLVIAASLLFARGIAGPLTELAETASQIASGDLERTAKIEREDEIGALAQAFNDMTGQLRELISSLEERVAVRTLELEQRSTYLEASAEVASAASSILNVEQLIQQAVELIRQRFSLYYVGLFLVDEIGEWAELRAGTGEAGRMMLARGHRIRIGDGMIGWCVANAQSRIALDVGEDAVRLATSELPETRSEAALPLRVRGRVIGALSVQSSLPAAFDEETVSVFQTMADQIAIALENARLLAESREALEAAGRAYGELSREAWVSLLQTRPDVGYRSGEEGVARIAGAWQPEMEQALQEEAVVQGDGDDEKAALAVPIKVRDQVIGVLGTSKPTEEGEWTGEELALLEVLTDQLGEALESARLYHDTQRRAAHEQLMGHIVDRMRRTVDMDALMQVTLQEMASALEVSSAFVQFGVGSGGGGDESGNGGQTDGSVKRTSGE